jgi:hypothetical protein
VTAKTVFRTSIGRLEGQDACSATGEHSSSFQFRASSHGGHMRNEPGRYIYGIIPRPPLLSFNLTGLDEKPVTVVPFENLAAVVSESPVRRYEVSRDYVLKHEWVIEQLMQYYTVLPVRFGTVAANEEDIRVKLLRRHFGSLHGMLKRLDNKVELGLKVEWNRERVFAALLDDEPELRLFCDALATRPAAESLYERVQLGQMVEQALTTRRSNDAQRILDVLRPLAQQVHESPIGDDLMVVNAAFLVDKRRESVFDARVRALDEESGDLMNFRYVGPLPPFNFVSLVVTWDDRDPASAAPDWDSLATTG